MSALREQAKNSPRFTPPRLTSLYSEEDKRHFQFSPQASQPPKVPTPRADLSSAWAEVDNLVAKARHSIQEHTSDFQELLHATEQITTAYQLKDLANRVMIDTLRNLHCNNLVKKKATELAEILHDQHVKEVQRTECWSENVLDVLENVIKTHQTTSQLLLEDYERAKQELDEFTSKHPDVDLSETSIYNTDEEASDSTVSSTRSGGSLSSSKKSSLFTLFSRTTSSRADLLREGSRLSMQHAQKRADFVEAVHILENKSSNLITKELNTLTSLYRDVLLYVEPEPFQAL